MIDFHSHTFFSDGVLSPAEHTRRAVVAGYKIFGISDHVDFSNIKHVFDNLMLFISTLPESGWDITIIPGIEITHVPARQIGKIISQARDMKIPMVIVHGESPVEPVEKGTNRASIEAGVDILAHPGLITEEDVKLAAKNGVTLEISGRRGHSLTNGHVAKLARKYQVPLALNSDAHSHDDFFKPAMRETILYGCGMEKEDVASLEKNMERLGELFRSRLSDLLR